MADDPVAVDLFCGGGGFSEGLRQAGFDITHALDVDAGACETYRLNHPETEVIQADILEFEPEELPSDVDLLFGSPPCTEFSWAKQGGGGDIEEGMKLVKRFIYFVIELDPDYWIMENVPRLDNYLPETIDLADIPWIDRTGSLDITKVTLDGDDYGTPQRRSRLFSGQFPVPEPSDEEVPAFDDIRAAFPRPTSDWDEEELVTDPTYDIELPAKELTDHFYNSHVTNREAEEIRVRKEDHSFYGRMSFPDDKDVPSRTVLATNRRVARETLVMEEETAPEGLSRFRKPTIREIGSIQGFPITYQFTGSSQAKKWRRVGDAVPPTVAFRIGQALRAEMGLDVPATPDVRTDTPHPDTNLNERDTSWKGRRRLSISRNFRHHIPHDNKQSFRVDVETDKDSTPRHPLADVDGAPEEMTHPVEYTVQLYRGYSSDVVSTEISLEESLSYVDALLEEQPEIRATVTAVIEDVIEEFGPQIPDATTLQAIRSRRAEVDRPLEYELLRTISDYDGSGIIDRHIPREADHPTVGRPELFDGTELPVRVLLKLFAASYLTTKLNACATWIVANPDEVFIQEDYEDEMDAVDLEAATCTREMGCLDAQIGERYLTGTSAETAVSAATDD